jgi:hypothetical protein
MLRQVPCHVTASVMPCYGKWQKAYGVEGVCGARTGGEVVGARRRVPAPGGALGQARFAQRHRDARRAARPPPLRTSSSSSSSSSAY